MKARFSLLVLGWTMATCLGFAQSPPTALDAPGDKYEEEISRLKSNLISQPNDLEARKELGLILERIRRPQEAFEQLSIAAKGLPADPQVSFALAEVCLMTRSTELALWYFYNASRGNDPAIAAQARKAFGTTDLRDLLAKLIIAYPFDARIRREYGFLLLNANDAAGATGQFEAAVKADPYDWQSLLQLGYLYDRAGQRERARTVFQSVASSRNPVYSKQAEEALRAWGGVAPTEGARPQPAAPSAAPDQRALVYSLHQQGKVTEGATSPYGNPGEPLYDEMDRAFKALAQQDYDGAIQHLYRASVLGPGRAEIHKQLGYAYIRTGQTGPAIQAFERVRQLAPDDYAALLQLAYLYQGARRDKEAAEVFQQVAHGPNAQAARTARASLSFLGNESLYEPMNKAYKALAVKDYDAAINDLQEAARIAPTRTDIHKQLAYAYIRTGQTDPAIREFERVRALDPNDSVALLQLGYLYDRAMRDEEAVDIFDHVAFGPDPQAAKSAKAGLVALGVKYAQELNRPPSPAVTHTVSPVALRKLGMVLLKIDQPVDAAVLLEAALKANMSDSVTSLQLGRVYTKLGKRELGQWYLYNATRGSDPSAAAVARKELGGSDPIEFLPALIAQYPNDNSFRREFGFMLLNRHRTDEAIGVFEGAVEKDSGDMLSQLQLGYLYQETKQLDKARAAFLAVAATKDLAYGQKAEEALHQLSEVTQPSVVISTANPTPTPTTPPPPATVDPTLELQNQGYRLHQQGKAKEAIEAFQTAHALAPNNSTIVLQIGYWFSEINELAQARVWLGMAASASDPATAAAARRALANLVRAEVAQIKTDGYRRGAAHDLPGAIAAFQRALVLDPADYNAMLQIGYWYSELEEFKQAEEWLGKAALSPHAADAEAARRALAHVKRLERPYFSSVYAQPLYDNRFQDFIAYGQFKTGLRLGRGAWKVEPYVTVRLWQDTRSQTGEYALPQIYSDNAAVFAVGVQVHPFTRYLNVFGEAGNGVSFLAVPPPDLGRSKPDYRGGFSYWRGAGPNLSGDQVAKHAVFSSAQFREVYCDTEYYSRYGNNIIGYFQYKEGFKTPQLGPLRTQVFGLTNLVKDSKGDYYNNVFEVGPGFRTAWQRHPSLQFYTEFVHGVYLTEGTRTHNYGSPNYNDLRIFFVYAISF